MNTITFSQKINTEMKMLVARVVSELLNDPDFGLELSAKVQRRLHKFSPSRRTIPLLHIRKKYY